MKNSVNHFFDAIAACIVGREHLAHMRCTCPSTLALFRQPNKKNMRFAPSRTSLFELITDSSSEYSQPQEYACLST